MRLLEVRETFASPALQRLWPYAMKHKRRLYLGALAAILASATNGVVLWILKHIIDNMTAVHPNPALINVMAGLLALAFMVRGVFSYGQNYFINSTSQRVLMQLRHEVYDHLQAMGLKFFDRHKTGQLMATITADIPQIQSAVGINIVDAIQGPLVVVGFIGFAFYLNWRLALISALIIPAMAGITSVATRRMRRATHSMQTALADISVMVEETLTCIRVVRACVTEDFERVRFVRRSEASFRAYMRGVRIQAALRPTVELIGSLGITLAVWFGQVEIVHRAPVFAAPHYFTFALLGTFVGALHYASQGFSSISGMSVGLQQASVAAGRVFAVMDEQPDVIDRPTATPLATVQGEIEFREVSFAYDGEPVLRGISFTAHPGEVIAIVGPSGAGKSTIANLIPHFYDVTGGAVLVDGHDVRDVTSASLRRQIGIVPQESILFGMSLRENIAYGLDEMTDEQIEAAAAAANALEFIRAMPEGLDTVVGQRGITLSGGQRQRIAIARAILRDPRILLLDEATSSLDAQSEALVQAALERLMPGRTTIIIAHRLSTVRNADRILVLDKGIVQEQGTHQQLLQRGGTYASLYFEQMRTGADDVPAGRVANYAAPRAAGSEDPTSAGLVNAT